MASIEATIWTEGKTDWQHLKKASEKLGLTLKLSFHEAEEGDRGADALLRKCKTFAETAQITPMIFVFDRDDESIFKQVSDPATGYRDWGNNVFSFAIPIPSHRDGYENVCIEFYYSDDDIKTEDLHERRLFLTSEFNEISGRCRHDPTVHIGNVNKLKGVTAATKAKIVDSQVFRNDTNIALAKSDFADHVYSDVHPFSNFNVDPFRQIFDIVAAITAVARPTVNIPLPDLSEVLTILQAGRPLSRQFGDILGMMVNVLEMTMYIFIASTIRSYERLIVDEPPEYAKKVRPIKKIITERFTSPTLTALNELTRYCYHLITESAPDELLKMKECFANPFTLGAIGDLLNDLEKIYSPDATKGRLLSRGQLRRELFDYVIPEISKYGSKIESLRADIEGRDIEVHLNTDTWQKALQALVAAVNPILSQAFVLESLEQVDTTNRNYQVSVRTYTNGFVSASQKVVSFEELDEFESNASSLLMTRGGSQISLHLFPFLLIKDDKLYYYRRTRAVGYEYYSPCDRSVYVVQTKRKFSLTAFGVGGRGTQQALFWTEVLPTISDRNGIKANIPTEGPVEFVGRKRQISKIKREILEIPNQNGIVYGVGGVGKTALMIQFSRHLFEEEDRESVLFDNIIWVSAKSNYYNPILDIVEVRRRQFESLDNLVSTILDFFEYEDLEGYSSEDRKGLLLELLGDQRVLLVLDNLETISQAEKESIIRFCEVEVKHALRRKPENFKVIITSREQIPCGFHQIGLNGLELRESKQLMASLYKQYQSASSELTDDQKERLHQVTSGIPILIKHCFGQIYEYSRPYDSVVTSFGPAASKKAVEFSFEEILKLLRADRCQLEVMLLLEVINCPLMIRHITEILGRNESEIESKIPSLVNFQCVKRANQGGEEKYATNEEIRLSTRRLAQENSELTQEIRKKIRDNFTVEKQMDYTTEEVGILGIFDNYLLEKQPLEAERFIEDQLEKKPESILLKYHYARYLQEQKVEIEQAIKILESIRELGNNHPSILRRLVSCYTSLAIPSYARASTYITQLETLALDDQSLKLEIGVFYVRWSISIKMNREISFVSLDEILRQQKYKELADKALFWLSQIKNITHEVYYLLAQSYFNKWDYENASKMIEKAVSLCKEDPRFYTSYKYLRNLIFTQRERHLGHRSFRR